MSKEEFPSFDKLLNSNWDYVYSYLLKKTSNKYISEEITIQSFSKAFEKIKTYNPKYNFKTWLISIAKNTYSDYLKKKQLLYKEVNSKKISQSKKDKFLEHLRSNIPNVIKEKGCIEYTPAYDIDVKIDNQAFDKNQITIIEKWKSIYSLQNHLQAPHMISYRKQV